MSEPAVAGETRTPGTLARVLLFFLALGGYGLAFSVAFPPGVPDRLPLLALSFALALAAAQRWSRGARLLGFLFPCAGLVARLCGGHDPAAWPIVLCAGFALGWTFRFIYDFETRPDASVADASLKALLVLWALATLLAAAQARTLWALFHGLALRTVNGEGLPETTALRESLLSFGALASGASFFLMMRRSGRDVRRRALDAALVGTAVSAAAAVLQRLALLPPEAHPFWRMTGRLSGGAGDPNSLGLLCGIALVVSAGRWIDARRRALPTLGVVIFAAGLVLSGSRSGLLVAGGSLALFMILRRRARSARILGLAAAALALLALAALLTSGTPGTLGGRLAATFDGSQSVVSRASARPVLWKAAVRLFREHPLEGGGMGVFTWRLPDLLQAQGVRWKMRDNPGSAYFQALAETGLLGLAVTLVFAAALARAALSRVEKEPADAVASACAVAVLAFLGALAVGSHWLAPDAGLLFFLAAAVAAPSASGVRAFPGRLWLAAWVVLYAGAAAVSTLSTAREAEAFRYSSRLGFYPPEPGGGFRWTQRHFALRPEPEERVRLLLANYSPLGRPVEVRATAAGALVWRGTVAPGRALGLRVSGAPAGARAVVFTLSSAFVPRALGIPGGDARELGLRAIFADANAR
ncbi:MAG TPA: O-antigen ligase family protein [Thermoanaerobaculia bacterium]